VREEIKLPIMIGAEEEEGRAKGDCVKKLGTGG
jgi:hypothetical protein